MHSTLIHFNPVNKRRQPISKYHIIPKIALPSTPGSPAWLRLQPEHLSSLPAPNFQPTANQEPDGPCGNQHYSRELLMMGIAVPETC